MKCSEKCIHQYFCKFKEEGSNCDYCEERPHITDEQISNAFQVAIANYREEKSKYLTPPPVPCCVDARKRDEDAPKPQEDNKTKKCPICGSDLYEHCGMCCYEGEKVKENEM